MIYRRDVAAELLEGAHDGALVHRGDAREDAGVLHAIPQGEP